MFLLYWLIGLAGMGAGLTGIFIGLLGRMPRFVGSPQGVRRAVGTHIQGRLTLVGGGALFIIAGYVIMLEGCRSRFGPKQAELDIFNRGVEFQRKAQWEQAIECYTKMLEAHPEYRQARVFRADCYEKRKMWTQAIADLEILATPISEYIIGRCYYGAGNYPKAIEQWSQYIKNYQGGSGFDVDVYAVRAMAYARTGMVKEAVADFTEAIQTRPGIPKDWRNRSTCYMAMGEYDKAQQDAKKALALAPDDSLSHLRLGQTLLCAGECAKAAEAFRKGFRLPAHDGNGQADCGLLLWVATARVSNGAKPDPIVTADRFKNDKWAATLFSLLTGKVSAEAAAKEALSAPSEDDRRERACAVHYYFGQRLLLAGQPDAARKEFKQCVDANTDVFARARWLAAAELSRR